MINCFVTSLILFTAFSIYSSSISQAVRRFKWTWAGMRQQDMKYKENRIHPTQKPVALYAWILKNYSAPNQKIIDTHFVAVIFLLL